MKAKLYDAVTSRKQHEKLTAQLKKRIEQLESAQGGGCRGKPLEFKHGEMEQEILQLEQAKMQHQADFEERMTLLLAELECKSTQVASLSEANSTLSNQLNTARVEVDRLNTELTAAQKAEESPPLVPANPKDYNSPVPLPVAILTEWTEYDERIKALQQQLQTTKADLQLREQHVMDLEQNMSEMETRAAAEMNELRSRITRLEESCRDAEKRAERLSEALRAKNGDFARLQQAHRDGKEKSAREIKAVEGENAQLQQAVNHLNAALDETGWLLDTLKEAERDNATIESAVGKKDAVIMGLRTALGNAHAGLGDKGAAAACAASERHRTAQEQPRVQNGVDEGWSGSAVSDMRPDKD